MQYPNPQYGPSFGGSGGVPAGTPVEADIVVFGNSMVDQNPTGLGDANSIQVEFGAGTSNAFATLAADGSMTFHIAGWYNFNMNLTYGRSTAPGVACIWIRVLLNGTQLGGSGKNCFVSERDELTKTTDFDLNLAANDVLTVEIMREDGAADDGGLFTSPANDGWEPIPSASIAGYQRHV